MEVSCQLKAPTALSHMETTLDIGWIDGCIGHIAHRSFDGSISKVKISLLQAMEAHRFARG
jgi:hypothetical protein